MKPRNILPESHPSLSPRGTVEQWYTFLPQSPGLIMGQPSLSQCHSLVTHTCSCPLHFPFCPTTLFHSPLSLILLVSSPPGTSSFVFLLLPPCPGTPSQPGCQWGSPSGAKALGAQGA